MIERVTVHHFKRFHEQVFDIEGHVVLAGPNNGGKTSLLQAIAIWNSALRKWLQEREPGETGKKRTSTAKERTGVAVTRRDLTAIPFFLVSGKLSRQKPLGRRLVGFSPPMPLHSLG